MLGLSALYLLVGAVMLAVACLIAMDKQHPSRLTGALFWACYALVFLLGDFLPLTVVGGLVIVLALLAGFGGLKIGVYHNLANQEQATSQQRLGNRLFLPALLIPVITLALSLGLGWWPQQRLIDAKNLTLVSLGIACLVAFAVALWQTKERPQQGAVEAKRLLEAMGWAFLLPQLLATLGLLFNQTGVGQAIAELARQYLQLDSRLAACAAYALAMAGLTIVMGNAFAAFPVITAGLGLPLLIDQHQANPAVMAAIGMFCGYCGTLLTPMAANFNVVPVALLQLRDQHAVIRAQAPTALLLLLVNIFLLNSLAF